MTGEEPTETILPIAEEVLQIGKRTVEVGRVRVALTTDTVEEVLRESLRIRGVVVERRIIGEPVTDVPRVRQEGDVLIIPVVEEILVVEKRLILREEVHLHLTEFDREVEHVATRRVQRAAVERVPSTEPAVADLGARADEVSP